MEAFLDIVMPKILVCRASFATYVYRGKADLLKKIGSRLRGYSKWLPQNYRLIVLIDRDQDDCRQLKAKLENEAADAGLASRSADPANWKVLNRIAVEELESWFFGDWEAVQAAYPGVGDVTVKQAYRLCDEIKGGTWEAFERVLQRKSYYKEGLLKVEAALNVASFFEPNRCKSPSFSCFRQAIDDVL